MQTFFAKRVGVDRRTIGEIENGRRQPSLKVAFKIVDYTGLTLDQIFQRPAAKAKR
jgi:DNA-binding XRE family transcriptional regulator